MHNVKTKVFVGAPESTKNEAVEAASQATGKPAWAAQVIRDANGKLVEVIVGLPEDVSAADLENAREAIDGNPGVSKATGFPLLVSDDDFEALVPNAEIFQHTSSEGYTYELTKVNQAARATKWAGTAAADAITGSGSLKYSDQNAAINSANHDFTGWMVFNALQNGLDPIYGFNMNVKVERPAVEDTVTRDIGDSGIFQFNVDGHTALSGPMIKLFYNIASGVPGNWFIEIPGPWRTFDTGVSGNSSIALTSSLNNAGQLAVSAGSVSETGTLPIAPVNFFLSTGAFESFSAAGIKKLRPSVMDDLYFEITA